MINCWKILYDSAVVLDVMTKVENEAALGFSAWLLARLNLMDPKEDRLEESHI